VDATRARIVATASELLASGAAPGGFSLDAVARAADVSRMTVYNQFGSRAGLLEAVFDGRAAQSSLVELPQAFSQADPGAALDAFVSVFVRFWAADPDGNRRLRAFGVLDAELGAALKARDERRRNGLRVILARLREATGHPQAEVVDDAVDVLTALTAFATFDALYTPERGPGEVVTLVQRAARAVILKPG
jgi:AcrR family transcriptional regulator